MDQYFNQMEKIIKERKTTSRIRFMLQDVLDLRRVHTHTHTTPHHHFLDAINICLVGVLSTAGQLQALFAHKRHFDGIIIFLLPSLHLSSNSILEQLGSTTS